MWSVIPSLEPILQGLAVALTTPSFLTFQEVLLGWVMCLGWRTERITHVGLMRGDAALHDPRLPSRRKGKSGPKPKHGPRLPKPREIAKKADRAKSRGARWQWKTTSVTAYSATRKLKVCNFQAVTTCPHSATGRQKQCPAESTAFGGRTLQLTDSDFIAAAIRQWHVPSRRGAVERDSQRRLSVSPRFNLNCACADARLPAR